MMKCMCVCLLCFCLFCLPPAKLVKVRLLGYKYMIFAKKIK